MPSPPPSAWLLLLQAVQSIVEVLASRPREAAYLRAERQPSLVRERWLLLGREDSAYEYGGVGNGYIPVDEKRLPAAFDKGRN